MAKHSAEQRGNCYCGKARVNSATFGSSSPSPLLALACTSAYSPHCTSADRRKERGWVQLHRGAGCVWGRQIRIVRVCTAGCDAGVRRCPRVLTSFYGSGVCDALLAFTLRRQVSSRVTGAGWFFRYVIAIPYHHTVESRFIKHSKILTPNTRTPKQEK